MRNNARRNIAVILASGVGQRSQFSRPKQLMKLGGRPVIAHVLARFQAHEAIDEIAIVTNALCMGEIEDLISREGFTKIAQVLLGGAERYSLPWPQCVPTRATMKMLSSGSSFTMPCDRWSATTSSPGWSRRWIIMKQWMSRCP